MSGRWVMELGESEWPMAMPMSTTEGWARSRARMAEVTTNAAPPSLSRLQSKSRNGSAITREAWSSSILTGVRVIALSRSRACARVLTAISPSWRLVVPSSSLWRRAIWA